MDEYFKNLFLKSLIQEKNNINLIQNDFKKLYEDPININDLFIYLNN